MNYAEVKDLLDKGFTVDEIRALMNPGKQQEQKEPEQKEPEQKEPEQKEPEQKEQEQKDNNPQNPQNNPQDFDERFTKLTETVEKLIKAVQGNNRLNDSFDKPSKDDIDKQVDSIMSSIIRPEQKKGE
ncbi:MAG: hypothetical protein J6R06_08350 [Bacteroidales bacterium]|nr:hypothetical protein [Bacteroidales bacterium]